MSATRPQDRQRPVASDRCAVVRRWNERIWRDDPGVFDELLAADCLFHWIGGIDEIKATIGRVRDSFDELKIVIDDQFDDGVDKVVTRWTLHGVHSGPLWGVDPSGRRVTYTGITLNRLRDGLIVEEWCETDLIGLMQQIGAFPQRSNALK